MFPAAVHKLGNLFDRDGHEIRLVGGCVRDKLLGIQPKDTDLATTATPDQIIAICDANGLSYADGGLKHGTVGIRIDHDMYEVTTLRIDVATDGRHAEVEFTTDWQQDALRRDFTINAMSMTFDGILHDYFDGRKHLDERRVCFVGDPEARVREDYLRILRYFRFAGRMGDLSGWQQYRDVLRRNVCGFAYISGERVWMEMSRILAGENVPQMLDGMSWIDLFSHIGIPDVDCAHAARAWASTRNPVTVLAALTNYRGIADSWKMSRQERLLLHWLQERRERARCCARLKRWLPPPWAAPTRSSGLPCMARVRHWTLSPPGRCRCFLSRVVT